MNILKLVHRGGIQMVHYHGIIDLRVDISGIILNMPGVQHYYFSAILLCPCLPSNCGLGNLKFMGFILN